MRVQNRFDSKEIGELVCDGALKYVQNFAVEIDGDRVAEYKSLDKVASDWKDYEPLIKDEKVRKAVRAWAEADGADEKIYLTIDENGSRFANKYGGYIEFAFRIYMEEGLYTLAELCGEEEDA